MCLGCLPQPSACGPPSFYVHLIYSHPLSEPPLDFSRPAIPTPPACVYFS